MIRLRLVILLMFAFYVAAAQDLQKLQHQLPTSTSNLDKMHALDALANYYTWTEGGYDQATAYGRQMIKLATESRDNKLIALAYVLNGLRLVEAIPSTEREKELRNYFDTAVQIAKKYNLPFYEASAYIGLAGIQFHVVLADGDEMLKWGEDALRLSTSISNDSLRSMAMVAIANGYRFKNNNLSAFRYFNDAMALAEKMHDPYLVTYSYRAFGRFYEGLKDYDKALLYFSRAFDALSKKEPLNHRDLHWLFFTQWNATWAYSSKGDHTNATASVQKVIELAKKYQLSTTYAKAPDYQMMILLITQRKYKEAKAFIEQRPDLEQFAKNHDYESTLYIRKAAVFRNTGQPDSADHYYRLAVASVDKSVPILAAGIYISYGNFLLEKKSNDSAILQFENAKATSEHFKDLSSLVTSYQNLEKAYQQSGNIAKAYEYNTLFHKHKDSLDQLSKEKEFALLELNNEQKKQEQKRAEDAANEAYKDRIRTYSLVSGLVVLLLIAGILYRNNSQKEKANRLLSQQKEKTEQALLDLKTTQSQLIQSEKMASLGELTAGIAHEIQNPLNFVTNFSELNAELIEELKLELKAGNNSEANAISDMIRDNEQKITYHGKRAEVIVKDMLAHSRSNTGATESTDINSLVDEYLRLSYHGLKAKDKSFNSSMVTDFDKSINKININPQDIGRVLLNLVNNAFYAVAEKQRHLQNGHPGVSQEYKPTVYVSTKKLKDTIKISIRDNGNGIPERVIDKIFQPFFTTKPTGKGTGLGLSLSYDIIKAHNGNLTLESKENEGAVFNILLPSAD